MALRDAFINVAQGAATAAANRAVTSVVGGIADGLKGRGGDSSDTSPLNRAIASTDTILAYPQDVATDAMQGHYVLFSFRKMTPGKIKSPKKTMSQNFNNLTKLAKDFGVPISDFKKLEQLALSGATKIRDKDFAQRQSIQDSKNNRSLTLSMRPSTTVTKTVALYMPPQVETTYALNYGDQDISIGAEAIKNAINNYKNAGLDSAVKGLGQDGGEFFKQMGIKTLDTVAPGAKALIALQTGKVITPRMELMFEGIGRRSFSFNFVFIPKSQAEARLVKEIIDSFKMHMTPKFDAQSGAGIASPRAMNIPDVFDINYMYRGSRNEYLNRIGTSYLTNLQVQYGGDRYTAYEPDPVNGGPPPQRTTLTLQFSELELMDRNRIEEGY
jgi:hypothetical protein